MNKNINSPSKFQQQQQMNNRDQYIYNQSPPSDSQQDQPTSPSKSASSTPLQRNSIIDLYTSNVLSKVAVAICAAISSYLIIGFLTGMIISKSPKFVTVPFALASLLSTFFPGDFGEFSRALGVLVIVILRRAKPITHINAVIKQLQAAIALGKRKQYPPSDNPWSYKQISDKDPAFNMYTTLLALLLIGSLTGNALAKPIPLFPPWIGSLILGSTMVYLGTFRDARGDLLRFVGSSSVNTIYTLKNIAGEVQLLPRATKITGRSFVFVSAFDKKYKISASTKKLFDVVLNKTMSQVERVQKDAMNAANE